MDCTTRKCALRPPPCSTPPQAPPTGRCPPRTRTACPSPARLWLLPSRSRPVRACGGCVREAEANLCPRAAAWRAGGCGVGWLEAQCSVQMALFFVPSQGESDEGSLRGLFRKVGPFSYIALPVDYVPPFITASNISPYPWELAYVPSKSTVVRNIVENVKRDVNTNMQGYFREGFLLVQHALDKAIMLYHGGSAAETLLNSVHVFVQRFPYPMHDLDIFYTFAVIFIPLIIAFIFSMNHLTLVQSIVWEKENRLKEYQLMIGLTKGILWTAYFLTFLCLYLITIICMCLIFYVKIKPAPIFQYSDPSLVFTFLLFYAISVIFFSFMISTFFNKETGIKWSNIFSPTLLDNFLFAYILGMFLFDAFLYGFVAWYVDAVFPGKYGIPKPWNFFLESSYWLGKSPEVSETMQYNKTSQSKYFEDEPTDLVAGIQIRHLYKIFQERHTSKRALNDLSLNLYEGQITVLLGQNGAGKSTTLSILSGLYPASSGKVYIQGYDISQHIVQIRKSLGVCPQQNLLFNYLTVSEHLYFYSMIKGVSHEMCVKEIDHMLSAFNLLEKQNAFSKSLSGGMKRKLSIIIALIGGSKVVIADEPTSGMDAASRRATWDLLRNYKKDRTILLTTHYMDEADVLGDRIAIMIEGSLKCCGSPFFLKQLYGMGYHIVMVKEPHCDIEEISKLICDYVPTATLESNIGTQLSFILPKDYSHRFGALFTTLEKRQKELGIDTFGASSTSMEEVFLRVSHLEALQTNIQAMQPITQRNLVTTLTQNRNMSSNVERVHSPTLDGNQTTVFNTGYSLYCQQFHAMFMKRLLFSRRNWRVTLVQILGLVFPTLFLFRIHNLPIAEEMSRQMNLDDYGHTIVPYSVSGHSNLSVNFLKHLKSVVKSDNHILKEVQGNLLDYLRKDESCIESCIIALSIEVRANRTVLTALFNNEAYHSPSLSLAVLDNILLMSLSGDKASLTVSNKPQPVRKKYDDGRTWSGKNVALDIQLGMALLISGFCFLTVIERAKKSKHIQFLSGVSAPVYWLSALVCDFLIFLVSCILLLGVFRHSKINIYIMNYHFLDTMLIFLLYGWSSIPLTYLMSFMFSQSTSAYIKLSLLNYMSGTYSVLLEDLLDYKTPTTISNATKTWLRNALLLFPNYNLAKCISDYPVVYEMKMLCTQKNVPNNLNCSKEKSLLKTEIKDLISKKLSGESEDKDIQDERKRILEQPLELLNSPVLLKELIKIYFKCPAILAVRNISFAVQKEECFGLLGFNGAGKTSIFQILTGEEIPTSGDVFIDGFNITKDIKKVRSRVGYCPQFDTLLEYMTGREILIMYARVCGVSEHQIHPYVNKHLELLELEAHADSLISTYSGGNKRRLSTAIAIMGKSSIIFLDEPSTGMDPVARHLLWNIVTMTCKSGRAVIMTSHSVEEYDALCTRLAIMVKGKFMCLGSPQHLKSKFGDIYILEAKFKTQDKLEDFKLFITMTFSGSVLKQENQGILSYYIPNKDNTWGQVFDIMENAKEQFSLEDYSINQMTLEQVLLTFANLDNIASDLQLNVP
ncbi:phospholipid-transporting ATPase ABCA3-like [Ctenodactylus gundi]